MPRYIDGGGHSRLQESERLARSPVKAAATSTKMAMLKECYADSTIGGQNMLSGPNIPAESRKSGAEMKEEDVVYI